MLLPVPPLSQRHSLKKYFSTGRYFHGWWLCNKSDLKNSVEDGIFRIQGFSYLKAWPQNVLTHKKLSINIRSVNSHMLESVPFSKKKNLKTNELWESKNNFNFMRITKIPMLKKKFPSWGSFLKNS